MEPNPYDVPREPAELPNTTSVIALRAAAIIFWVLAPIPATAILVPLFVFETAKSRAELPFRVFVMATVEFILPPIGLALLGAGCWWRIRWIGLIGLYALIPLVLMLALTLLRS